ncbi:hypothetical protein [Novosphingobium sp. 11B]
MLATIDELIVTKQKKFQHVTSYVVKSDVDPCLCRDCGALALLAHQKSERGFSRSMLTDAL